MVGYELLSGLPTSEGDFPGEMISAPTSPVGDPLSHCLRHFNKLAESPPAKFYPGTDTPRLCATGLAAADLVCSHPVARIRSDWRLRCPRTQLAVPDQLLSLPLPVFPRNYPRPSPRASPDQAGGTQPGFDILCGRFVVS